MEEPSSSEIYEKLKLHKFIGQEKNLADKLILFFETHQRWGHLQDRMARDLLIPAPPINHIKRQQTSISSSAKSNKSSARKNVSKSVAPVVLPPTPGKKHFLQILQMFQHAQKKLQKPTAKLIANGINIVLYVAGDHTASPGSVNVVLDSRSSNIWFGRIEPNGDWRPGKWSKERQLVESFLQVMNQNPAKIAKDYGKKTGICCFCAIPLTDERSVNSGYGPICATHYKLPWG